MVTFNITVYHGVMEHFEFGSEGLTQIFGRYINISCYSIVFSIEAVLQGIRGEQPQTLAKFANLKKFRRKISSFMKNSAKNVKKFTLPL